MIRKLRLKIVGISLVTVAAVLLSALVVLALSTRSQMVHSSEEHLAAALEEMPTRTSCPAAAASPVLWRRCLPAERYASPAAATTTWKIRTWCWISCARPWRKKNDSGVLKDYSLRYMRWRGVVSVRIAFTDCSMEAAPHAQPAAARLVGGPAGADGLSYWLAGFAVRPVQRPGRSRSVCVRCLP